MLISLNPPASKASPAPIGSAPAAPAPARAPWGPTARPIAPESHKPAPITPDVRPRRVAPAERPVPESPPLAARALRPVVPYRGPTPSATLRKFAATASGGEISAQALRDARGQRGLEAEALLAEALGRPAHQDDVVLYNQLLHVCRRDTVKLRGIEAMMRQRGVAPTQVTINTLVLNYAHHGAPEDAVRIFDIARARPGLLSVTTCNVMIDTFGRNHRIDDAWAVYRAMPGRKLVRDAVTYNALVTALLDADRDTEACEVLEDMAHDGVPANAVTYTIMMDRRGKAHDMAGVKALHAQMLQAGVMPTVQTSTVLLRELLRARELDAAHALFAQLQSGKMPGDTMSYTTMIDGLCRSGEAEAAYRIFTAMPAARMRRTEATYEAMIHGALQAQQYDRAWALFDAMSKEGLGRPTSTWRCLIDGYYHNHAYREGLARLKGRVVPLGAQASYADLLRKAKRPQEAVVVCEQVMKATPSSQPLHHQAYVVRLYAWLALDLNKARAACAHPPFDATSVQWARLLCGRVFAGAVGSDKTATRAALTALADQPRNSSSSEDIAQALQKLSLLP